MKGGEPHKLYALRKCIHDKVADVAMQILVCIDGECLVVIGGHELAAMNVGGGNDVVVAMLTWKET